MEAIKTQGMTMKECADCGEIYPSKVIFFEWDIPDGIFNRVDPIYDPCPKCKGLASLCFSEEGSERYGNI